jgi:ribosome biogenesis GTPase
MKIGTVIKSTGSKYLVKTNDTEYFCNIRGKFRTSGLRSTSPIAVGDLVKFKVINEEQKHGLIQEIQDRKNILVRKSTNLSKKSHILAANIDLAILMVTLKDPETYQLFIDRFLVASEKANIPAALVFNKIDLLNTEEREQLDYLYMMYKSIGYPCVKISVREESNIEALKQLIAGKTVVINGNSGVGKSSLLNLLAPDLNLKTAEISEMHRQGKHTTTFAEMFEIGDARLIDSPGIKGYGLTDIDYNRLSEYFREMNALRSECKFNNCTHTHEPGCRIKEAVENFEISPDRYKNYLKILDEKDDKYREDIYK